MPPAVRLRGAVLQSLDVGFTDADAADAIVNQPLPALHTLALRDIPGLRKVRLLHDLTPALTALSVRDCEGLATLQLPFGLEWPAAPGRLASLSIVNCPALDRLWPLRCQPLRDLTLVHVSPSGSGLELASPPPAPQPHPRQKGKGKRPPPALVLEAQRRQLEAQLARAAGKWQQAEAQSGHHKQKHRLLADWERLRAEWDHFEGAGVLTRLAAGAAAPTLTALSLGADAVGDVPGPSPALESVRAALARLSALRHLDFVAGRFAGDCRALFGMPAALARLHLAPGRGNLPALAGRGLDAFDHYLPRRARFSPDDPDPGDVVAPGRDPGTRHPLCVFDAEPPPPSLRGLEDLTISLAIVQEPFLRALDALPRLRRLRLHVTSLGQPLPPALQGLRGLHVTAHGPCALEGLPDGLRTVSVVGESRAGVVLRQPLPRSVTAFACRRLTRGHPWAPALGSGEACPRLRTLALCFPGTADGGDAWGGLLLGPPPPAPAGAAPPRGPVFRSLRCLYLHLTALDGSPALLSAAVPQLRRLRLTSACGSYNALPLLRALHPGPGLRLSSLCVNALRAGDWPALMDADWLPDLTEIATVGPPDPAISWEDVHRLQRGRPGLDLLVAPLELPGLVLGTPVVQLRRTRVVLRPLRVLSEAVREDLFGPGHCFGHSQCAPDPAFHS